MKKLTTSILLFLYITIGYASPDDTVGKASEHVDSLRSKNDTITKVQRSLNVNKTCSEKDNDFYVDDFISVSTDSAGFDSNIIANIDSVRLWINGYCFVNIRPYFISANREYMVFRISYDTSQYSPWRLFYCYPIYWQKDTHLLTIQLGTVKGVYKNYKSSNAIILHTSVKWMKWVGYTFYLFILLIIIIKCKGLLRDTGLYQENGVQFTDENLSLEELIKQGKIKRKDIPFSLARFQFLTWLLVVLLGAVHIWVIQDNLVEPTGTVLVLLGISGGTLYIAKLIDSTPATTQTVTTASPPPPPKTASEYVTDFYDKFRKPSFIYDVLNDGRGISLHRLQLFVFTIFLGFYFLWYLASNLAMPQFSDTLLGLMGISSTTYAGLKTIEKK